MRQKIHLGLIGDNIKASQSPRLHKLAGAQQDMDVIFDLLIPAEQHMDFPTLFNGLAGKGYRGVSVTHPYKEQAAARVEIGDPLVRAIGAVNTVIFERGSAFGFNTDYHGFLAAYRGARPDLPPGAALMIGAGGVGRAIGFALGRLGATSIRLADRDIAKAAALSIALRSAFPDLEIEIGTEGAPLAAGSTGVVNCSPVGMVGHEGMPLPASAIKGCSWAFDAVYTPADTEFLRSAGAMGLTTIPGTALFFQQGVAAWRIFSNLPLDEGRLRDDLNAAQ